ncbi:MAG: hypothetical protein AAB532_03815 [Patescibacteria group bacterium]
MIKLPNKSNNYPFYIFASWIIIWVLYLIFSIFITLTNLTPDGKYVQKEDSKPYFVLVNSQLKYDFISSGIIIGFGVIFGGYSLMAKKYLEEKKRKKK